MGQKRRFLAPRGRRVRVWGAPVLRGVRRTDGQEGSLTVLFPVTPFQNLPPSKEYGAHASARGLSAPALASASLCGPLPCALWPAGCKLK